jgi:uncharacterized repeat protein (TIGR03803 family)
LPLRAPTAHETSTSAPNRQLNNSKTKTGYELLYDFAGSPDGFAPQATFLEVNGLLYGTTRIGGANQRGTVFIYDPSSNSERTIYSFTGSPDGDQPYAGLVEINGALYGTTSRGGTYGFGTVYRITRSGKERVLYSFKGPPDGAYPYTGLTAVDGVLYGTTSRGGSSRCRPSSSGPYGCGAIFRITRSGREKILHRFHGGKQDGAWPWTQLLPVRATLYGTASLRGPHGAGLVYAIGLNGGYRVVYSFGGPPDGSGPMGELIIKGGNLYGTTYEGGNYGNSGGWGTVFKLSENGKKERVLYSFGNSIGALPFAGVLYVNGRFFGTTAIGEGGTIFEMTLSGKAKLLHHFAGPPDGDAPLGNLTLFDGVLYGTTAGGGQCEHESGGCGTIFKIVPT